LRLRRKINPTGIFRIDFWQGPLSAGVIAKKFRPPATEFRIWLMWTGRRGKRDLQGGECQSVLMMSAC
jgi:hypothetical protein